MKKKWKRENKKSLTGKTKIEKMPDWRKFKILTRFLKNLLTQNQQLVITMKK